MGARLRGQQEGHEDPDMGPSLSSVFPVLASLGRWENRSAGVSPNNHHLPRKILSFYYQHCASELPQPSPYGQTGWRLRAFPQLDQEWDLVVPHEQCSLGTRT